MRMIVCTKCDFAAWGELNEIENHMDQEGNECDGMLFDLMQLLWKVLRRK